MTPRHRFATQRAPSRPARSTTPCRCSARRPASIAEASVPFASRSDDSGTHRAERRLWQAAGVTPSGAWYRETGAGMGPTLNTAAGMNAYTLADRATWAAFANRQDLTLLVEGDPRLHNPYGSILVDPTRHAHVKSADAKAWHDWLTSREGQDAIARFRVDGLQVFFPDAVKDAS